MVNNTNAKCAKSNELKLTALCSHNLLSGLLRQKKSYLKYNMFIKFVGRTEEAHAN